MSDHASRPRVLIASEVPGGAAGISVAAEVLLAALSNRFEVGVLTHSHRVWPSLRRENGRPYEVWRMGTQPIVVHAEGSLAGLLHRRALSRWDGVWVVGSRHAGAPRAAGLPYVVWEATTLSAELDLVSRSMQRATGLGSGWGAALHRALAPLNDRVEGATYRGAVARLGMSEYSRTTMAARAGTPLEAVDLLPAPPRPAFLQALHQPMTRHRSDVFRVLLVGRIADTRKNVPLFLRAMHALRERGVRCEATIIGPVTEVTRAQLTRAAGDWLTLTGEVDIATLARAYRTHDLLVVSSRQEGYGFTVVEAMHAGLPIVSTRCGGPDAMIEQSAAGVLTPHDADAIAAAAERIARDREHRERMSRAATAYASRELSPEVFGVRAVEITRRLVDTGRRALGA